MSNDYVISKDTYNQLKTIYPQISEEAIPIFASLSWTHDDLASNVEDALSDIQNEIFSDPKMTELTPQEFEQIVIDITNDIIANVKDIDAECVTQALSRLATQYVRKHFSLTPMG
jgi:hypothetical protein